MKKIQVTPIIYSLRVSGGSPLDDKTRISSLDNILTELPLIHRFDGLIFWVVDIQKYYCFDIDLTLAKPLSDLLSETNGLAITSVDYTNLLSDLNNTTQKLGSLITVFPLGVTYVFDGTVWKYHSGIYRGDTTTLNNTLKNVGSKIILPNNSVKIFNADFTLSDEVIVVTVLPETIENNRYYLVNGILYFVLGNTSYQLGGKNFIVTAKALVVGNNQITHNLKSTYIRGLFWINNIGGTGRLITLFLSPIDINNANIDSRLAITGNLIISTEN